MDQLSLTVDPSRLARLAADGFRFLADLGPLEEAVVLATGRKDADDTPAETLAADLRARVAVFAAFEVRRRPVR